MPELMENVIHYPQLDTVLMVEDFIRKNSGEFRKRQLWEHLPRKMMYQTFCVVFAYLMDSGKIVTDKNRYVVWIWNPAIVRKYMNSPHLWLK